MAIIDEVPRRSGQAPLPARTHPGKLSRVTPTADTNADERTATGKRQGEGAWL
jgi:hypothetical protein